MEKFKILNGKSYFYQWDYDQKLAVLDDTVTEVHFPLGTESCPIVPVYKQDGQCVVDVPNILLQTAGVKRVYAFIKDNLCGRTIYTGAFEVKERAKPDDYIYTETEVWTAEKAVKEAVEEAVASGDFKGDKGDKGDAGVINFVVVTELPDVGDESSIYLVPNNEPATVQTLALTENVLSGKWEFKEELDMSLVSKYGHTAPPTAFNVSFDANGNHYEAISFYDSGVSYKTDKYLSGDYEDTWKNAIGVYGSQWLIETREIDFGETEQEVDPILYQWITANAERVGGSGNNFDEYIFVNGTWEKIGSTSVGANLDEYVKKTDVEKGFVPKYEPTANSTTFLYAVRRYSDGTIEHLPYRASASVQADVVPVTGVGGALRVGTPTSEQHATPKSYVDALIDETKRYAQGLINAIPKAEGVGF